MILALPASRPISITTSQTYEIIVDQMQPAATPASTVKAAMDAVAAAGGTDVVMAAIRGTV